MKILMIALFAVRSCGPTEVIKKVVPELISLGHNVDVLSPYAYDKEKEDLAYHLGMNYYYTEKLITSIQELKKTVPSIEEYDIVHFHGVYEYKNWIIAKILKKIKKPYVYTIHGNLMAHALQKSRFKKIIAINFFIRKILDNAVCIHALSKNEANDISRITRNKIICIPNGIDQINSINRHNNSLVRFLYIGRMDVNHKGLDLLFDAINQLPVEQIDKCEFIFAGPFETTSDEKYINNNIVVNGKYIGPVYGEEKQKQLENCDYFIHTSRYEGMPMAVLEALSYGIPCVVTTETNMEDIVRESNGGIVSQCSVDDIKEAIIEAIENNGSIQVSTEWLRKYLLWDRIANNYEELYSFGEIKFETEG